MNHLSDHASLLRIIKQAQKWLPKIGVFSLFTFVVIFLPLQPAWAASVIHNDSDQVQAAPNTNTPTPTDTPTDTPTPTPSKTSTPTKTPSKTPTLPPPPDTTITDAPPAQSNDTSPSISFDSIPSGAPEFYCSLVPKDDAPTYSPCTSPLTLSVTVSGFYDFYVYAKGPGGADASPEKHTWELDLNAPPVNITSSTGTNLRTKSTTAVINFASADPEVTKFECKLNTSAWQLCNSGTITYTTTTTPAVALNANNVFNVRAVDPAGNFSSPTAQKVWFIDTVAPETTITGNPPAYSNQVEMTFNFISSEPTNATFKCALDGGNYATCTTGKKYSSLVEGEHTFNVIAIDQAGNEDASAATHTWTVDITPPTGTTIQNKPSSPTNQTTANFTFASSAPENTFVCQLDSGTQNNCPASHTITGLTPNQSHTLKVWAKDLAGNLDTVYAEHTWAIDTVAPTITMTANPSANRTNSTSITFTITAPTASSLECKLDGQAYATCPGGNPEASTISYFSLSVSETPHVFTVRAKDSALNESTKTYSWTVDQTPPDLVITKFPLNPSKSTTATFEFIDVSSPLDATFYCAFENGETSNPNPNFSTCTSPLNYPSLTTGSAYTVYIRAIDAAGNISSTERRSWRVYTQLKNTLFKSKPNDPSSASVKFSYEVEKESNVKTFKCRLDSDTGPFEDCSQSKSYSSLSNGQHTFDVYAVNGINYYTAAIRYVWIVNDSSPYVTIVTNPSDPSNSKTPLFEFTYTGVPSITRYKCRINQQSWFVCPTPYSAALGSDGLYTLDVFAEYDSNSSTLTDSYSWVLDTQKPTTTIFTTIIGNASNSSIADFSLLSTELASIIECKLDNGTFANCSDPGNPGAGATQYTGLSDGSHTFYARATDEAGNTENPGASYTWVVDTPLEFTQTPPLMSNTPQPTFQFTYRDTNLTPTYECAVDSSTYAACVSPFTTAILTNAQHTITVRAKDSGNQVIGIIKYTWTVDTQAPNLTITSNPSSLTNLTSATFTFSSTDPTAQFECKLDLLAATSCNSKTILYTGLSSSLHTFTVTATDPATNFTTQTYQWTVDTIPPTTVIQSTPANPSTSRNATFAFQSPDGGVSFLCSLDGTSYTNCTSPKSYSNLPDGFSVFYVKATDSAGNTATSPTTYSWTIDATPPQISITQPNPSQTNNTTPTITGVTEVGATVYIRFESETKPNTTRPVTVGLDGSWSYTFSEFTSDGTYKIVADASDNLGNNQTSAPITIILDTKQPIINPITATPSALLTSSTQIDISFTANETSTFSCSIDSGTEEACTSPKKYTTLSDGAHTITIVARDLAGNTSSKAYSWTVDATAPTLTILPEQPGPTTVDFIFSSTEKSQFYCEWDFEPGVEKICNTTPPIDYSYKISESINFKGIIKNGLRTLSAYAKDEAGNKSSIVTTSWLVQRPPEADKVSPSNPSFVQTATFSSTINNANPEAQLKCALNSVVFKLCTNPKTYFWSDGLAYGWNTFYIGEVDPDNPEAAPKDYSTFQWVINETVITAKPPLSTTSKSAQFKFGTQIYDATMKYECALNSVKWAACEQGTSQSYKDLKPGSYTFLVRAITTDKNKNVEVKDSTPATYTWTVQAERIINGSFNAYPTSTSKIPTGWGTSGWGSADGKDSTIKVDGASIKMIGNGVTKSILQSWKPGTLMPAGTQFTFATSIRGTNILSSSSSICRIEIILYDSTDKETKNYMYCPIGSYGFVRRIISFTATTSFKKVDIKFIFKMPKGSIVWFDQASLLTNK